MCVGLGLRDRPDTEFGAFLTTVVFTESRPANKFGVALAGVLSSSAGEIKTTLKEKLVPAERQKAEKEAEDTSRTQRQAVILADLDVQVAEAALSAALAVSPPVQDTVLKAQIELAKKKIAANAAYRRAGRTVPYPEFD